MSLAVRRERRAVTGGWRARWARIAADVDTALAGVRAESPASGAVVTLPVVAPAAPAEPEPCAPEIVGSGDARTVVCRGCGWRTHKPTALRYAKGAKTRHEKDYAAKVAGVVAGGVPAAA